LSPGSFEEVKNSVVSEVKPEDDSTSSVVLPKGYSISSDVYATSTSWIQVQ
jgi:hypothetical protein